MKKVLVAVPETILAAIDAVSDNRSAFIRQAIDAMLAGTTGVVYESPASRKEREFEEFLGANEFYAYQAAQRATKGSK